MNNLLKGFLLCAASTTLVGIVGCDTASTKTVNSQTVPIHTTESRTLPIQITETITASTTTEAVNSSSLKTTATKAEQGIEYYEAYTDEDYIDFDFAWYRNLHMLKEQEESTEPALEETIVADTVTEDTDLQDTSENNARYEKYLFIGDSRTIGMSCYELMEYFAEVACGLDYFYEHYDEITAYTDYNIVINLGVNDLYKLDDYIDMYWNLPEKFVSSNHIIVVSVNPTSGSYDNLNSDIDWFNDNLSVNLPEDFEWIDTNSYLKDTGFETSDGLHYLENTYRKIYEVIVSTVN